MAFTSAPLTPPPSDSDSRILVLDTRISHHWSLFALLFAGAVIAVLFHFLPFSRFIFCISLYTAIYYLRTAMVYKNENYAFGALIFSLPLSLVLPDKLFYLYFLTIVVLWLLKWRQQLNASRPTPEEILACGLVWRFDTYGTFMRPFSASVVIVLTAMVGQTAAQLISNLSAGDPGFLTFIGILIMPFLLKLAIGFRKKVLQRFTEFQQNGSEWLYINAEGVQLQSITPPKYTEDITNSIMERHCATWQDVTHISFTHIDGQSFLTLWGGYNKQQAQPEQITFQPYDTHKYWLKTLHYLRDHAVKQQNHANANSH